jgi:RNA polymerase sigma-70 factor (ECF subfamily)
VASSEMAFGSAECVGPNLTTERALVDQCRLGDGEAFSRLVALHERMVFSLALRLLGDPEEARDLSQEVFLQVYRHLHRFEGRSSLKTWIYRIVVNQSRNRQRWWRRRRKERSCPLEDLTPADEARASLSVAAGEDSPFDRVSREERARRVQVALLELPFHQRTILVLREVEGLSCDAIAATLGLPEGTVKSRLSRAREALKIRLLPALEGRTRS